jgi:hypothetical protein
VRLTEIRLSASAAPVERCLGAERHQNNRPPLDKGGLQGGCAPEDASRNALCSKELPKEDYLCSQLFFEDENDDEDDLAFLLVGCHLGPSFPFFGNA